MGRGHHLAPALLPGGLWLSSSSDLELSHRGSVTSLLALVILLIKQPGGGAWLAPGKNNGPKREQGAASTASHTRLSKEQLLEAGRQSPVGKGRGHGVFCASCLVVPHGTPAHLLQQDSPGAVRHMGPHGLPRTHPTFLFYNTDQSHLCFHCGWRVPREWFSGMLA